MERDKNQKCECGKSMPILPYCCKKCGLSSLKDKKIEIVDLKVRIEKPNWEDEFDKEFDDLFCFLEAHEIDERKRVKDFIKNHFVGSNKMVVDNKVYEITPNI